MDSVQRGLPSLSQSNFPNDPPGWLRANSTFVYFLQSENTLAYKQLPLAGRLRFHKNEWEKLTSDKTIINIIMGYKIDFMLTPVATSVQQPHFTPIEEKALQTVIDGLLEKQVIERSTHETGEFISPVFLRPKKNGKSRLILNLRN